VKSINLVVACDGFLGETEIIRIFHSGYLDYRGAFQAVLLFNKLNIADREGQWIIRFQMITGAYGIIIFFIVVNLIVDILFKQFLIRTAV